MFRRLHECATWQFKARAGRRLGITRQKVHALLTLPELGIASSDPIRQALPDSAASTARPNPCRAPANLAARGRIEIRTPGGPLAHVVVCRAGEKAANGRVPSCVPNPPSRSERIHSPRAGTPAMQNVDSADGRSVDAVLPALALAGAVFIRCINVSAPQGGPPLPSDRFTVPRSHAEHRASNQPAPSRIASGTRPSDCADLWTCWNKSSDADPTCFCRGFRFRFFRRTDRPGDGEQFHRLPGEPVCSNAVGGGALRPAGSASTRSSGTPSAARSMSSRTSCSISNTRYVLVVTKDVLRPRGARRSKAAKAFT